MSPISIGSPAEFSRLLTTTTVVVADFYADWCGPCKTIAPVYESLSTTHSAPKRVAFTKINVDNQQEISKQYGVTAMPTFLIFKNGSVVNTIRGADRAALTSAVEAAVKNVGAAKATFASAGSGRTLGGPAAGRSTGGGGGRGGSALSFEGFLGGLINFIGLYVVSLVSFDAYGSAEGSPFNKDAGVRVAGL